MPLPATVAGDRPTQLQLPDVRRLERMPSWPAWVASRIALLKPAVQPDPVTGTWREALTLPKSSILKAEEREEVIRHVTDLCALCQQTPAHNAQDEENTLLAVTKMMLVLPSTTQNEVSVEARGEAFMDALEDVPAWAVRSAIRRWNRGDCGLNDQGRPYDYHWCPAPAELRRIAWADMYRIKGRVDTLERLLRAEPLIEFGEAHCSAMRARLATLIQSSTTPPVGKDGSGGAVGRAPSDGAHCGTQPKHSPA